MRLRTKKSESWATTSAGGVLPRLSAYDSALDQTADEGGDGGGDKRLPFPPARWAVLVREDAIQALIFTCGEAGVVVGVVVGVSSLSGHNVALDMKLTTKLCLYEFTLAWDPY